MSDTSAFADLLKTKVDDAKEPVPLPVGTYRALVDSYEMGHSAKKKTPYVRFMYRIQEADADVDEDQLNDFLEDGKLADTIVRTDFYITPKALFMLRNHLENDLGMDCEGRDFEETIPEAVGQEVMVNVNHSSSDDGSRVYVNVTGFAQAE